MFLTESALRSCFLRPHSQFAKTHPSFLWLPAVSVHNLQSLDIKHCICYNMAETIGGVVALMGLIASATTISRYITLTDFDDDLTDGNLDSEPDRQESQRRGKLTSASKHHLVPEPLEIKTVPEKCKPTQCPFCIGNVSKPYQERTKPLSTVNKLWDHVESVHRDELAAYASGKKACSICKARGTTFTPSSVPHFKNHTQKVHVIRLRP
jgi:hypothetical protein